MYDIKMIAVIPPPFGGVSVYVKRLINQLVKDGFSVGGYYNDGCKDETFIKSCLFHKWTWMQTWLFPIKVWKYLMEVAPFSIVHSHFSLEGMAYLWSIKVFAHKRIIITVHNSMNETYYSNTNPINRFFLNRLLESGNVTWITVSAEGKRQLESLPIKPVGPVFVIPAYIPIADHSNYSLDPKLDEYIKSHNKIITFYGHSFMTNDGKDVYGFRVAIQVYAMLLKKTKLKLGMVFCIADYSDLKRIQELHQLANTYRVDDRIYWQVGAIDNMKSLWKKTDIYFRPTSTDGDSVAIREALDEGLIVVASDVVERPLGVHTYAFGNDQDAYRVLNECLQFHKMGAASSWDSYERMKRVYENILKESNK